MTESWRPEKLFLYGSLLAFLVVSIWTVQVVKAPAQGAQPTPEPAPTVQAPVEEQFWQDAEKAKDIEFTDADQTGASGFALICSESVTSSWGKKPRWSLEVPLNWWIHWKKPDGTPVRFFKDGRTVFTHHLTDDCPGHLGKVLGCKVAGIAFIDSDSSTIMWQDDD